jgi:hypothetical protein
MHLLGSTYQHPKQVVVGFDVGSHGGISMGAMCARHIHNLYHKFLIFSKD